MSVMCLDMEWPASFNKTNLSWICTVLGCGRGGEAVGGACTFFLWTLRLLRRLVWQSKHRRQNARGCLSLAPWPLTKQAAGCRKVPYRPQVTYLILHSDLPLTCCVLLSKSLQLSALFSSAMVWVSPSLYLWPSTFQQNRRPYSIVIKNWNCEGKLLGCEYWTYQSLLSDFEPAI